MFIYWSYGGETPDGNWHGWGTRLRQLCRTTSASSPSTRWERTFQPDPLMPAGGTARAAAPRSPRVHPLRDYLEALLVAVVFAIFARTCVVQAFKIPSGSMEPNLLVGDHILVNKFVYGAGALRLWKRCCCRSAIVRRGDVVVFQFPADPERDFIKRCVGLPGDLVELRDKQLYVNGSAVDDSALRLALRSAHLSAPAAAFREPLAARDNFGPYHGAAGQLLLPRRQPRQLERLAFLGSGRRSGYQGTGAGWSTGLGSATAA